HIGRSRGLCFDLPAHADYRDHPVGDSSLPDQDLGLLRGGILVPAAIAECFYGNSRSTRHGMDGACRRVRHGPCPDAAIFELSAVWTLSPRAVGLEQVVTGLNGLRRSDFCIAGRSGAKGVSGNTVEPCDEAAGKKRPAHAGCVLAGARVVAALVRCARIDLRAAPAGRHARTATQT